MNQPKNATVSITPELAEQIGRYPGEDWNALACGAFARRLRELKMMDIKDEKERAVARLRASKKQAESENYRAGELAGTHFVLHDAEWPALQRLDLAIEEIDREPRCSVEDFSFDQIAKNIEGGEVRNDPEWAREIEKKYGDLANQSEFVHGFVRGALAKFEELKQAVEEE